MRKCIVFLVWVYRLLLVANVLMANTVYKGVHGTSLVYSQLFDFWGIQPVSFLRKKKRTFFLKREIPLLISAPRLQCLFLLFSSQASRRPQCYSATGALKEVVSVVLNLM